MRQFRLSSIAKIIRLKGDQKILRLEQEYLDLWIILRS